MRNDLLRKRLVQFAAAAALLTGTSSCSDQSLSPDQVFVEAEEIADRLRSQLEGNVMGYTAVISYQGDLLVELSGGMARNDTDIAREFRIEDKLHIGQLSQFITAVASVRFLRDRQISLTESIADYLPAGWEKGENLDQVRFINLLTHTSGFLRPGSQRVRAATLDSLRLVIQQGALPEESRVYTHQNFAMMRVLIPQIIDRGNRTLGPQPLDFDYGFVFREYLRKELFPAAGLDDNALQTTQMTEDPPLAYYGPDDAGFGYGNNWNYILISGAFGYYLNIRQLASFWNLFWYSDRLLNGNERELMKSERIGFDPADGSQADRAFIKSGSWVYASNQEGLAKTVESFAGHFPDGWDLLILTNSPHSEDRSLTEIALKSMGY
ncbi:MAG: hypothetical protein EA360_08765 [Balneolaceae bacterium]|nr:MAG: hypothetical protein EA360_08765 [Balneolaceae bacterium]